MMSRDDSGKTQRTWLEECLAVKKLFIGGDINGHVGTVRGGLRRYMRVLDMANKIKREKTFCTSL
jgi:hypothetical protein